MMIYDCFLFNDELDLLRLRLSYLDGVVDKFVLVESGRTLSGQPKPLHFELNKERFSQYLHKIIHVVAPVNDMNAWEYEFFQRNCIKQGLINCGAGDLVFISDADEIVNIQAVLSVKNFRTPALVELPVYYYYFNLKTNDSFRVNLVAEWSFLKDKDLGNRNENFPKWSKLMIGREINPGWHFSYCYGNNISRYQEKIRSFSHQEYNTVYYLEETRIQECIRQGKDIFERKHIRLEQVDNGIEPILPYIHSSGLVHLIRTSFNGEFSIILPNYNHEKFLPGRIESILKQDHQNFELILMDDASDDNSRDILEKYNDARISKRIYNKESTGSPFLQWKQGVLAAKHDYIWIAESDDQAEPGFLSAMCLAINNDPTAGIFYCDSWIIDENGIPGKKFSEIKNGYFKTEKWAVDYRLEGIAELNDFLKYACTINNVSACIFRKDLLQAILGELSGFTYHGDWFAYINSALKSPVHYIAKPLNNTRAHPGSLLAGKDQLASKLEHFRILSFLLRQKKITGGNELTGFFSDQYLGISARKDGLFTSIKTIALYGSHDFPLALKVLARIIRLRFTGKKIKPVF